MRILRKNLVPSAMLLVLCVAGEALGEGSEERLRIRPELTVTLVGDDNVHHEKQDEESAFGSWIAPSLGVDYRRGAFRAHGELGADVRLYTGGKDLNDEYFVAVAELEYEVLRGLTLAISNIYVPHPVWLGRPTDDIGNLVQSNTLMAEGRFRREFERSTALEFGVRSSWFATEGFETSIDLDGDGVFEEIDDFHADYLDFSAFIEGQYSLGRRALLFARGLARKRDFDELSGSDFTEFSGVLGMRTQWARRIWLEVSGGYGTVNYDGLPNDGRFVSRATLEYRLQRGWTLKTSFSRTLTSDAAGVEFAETYARLGLEKRLGSRTRAYLGLWWNRFNSDASGSRRNSSTAFETSVRHQLTRHIEAALVYRHWRNGGDNSADDFRQNRVTLAFSYRY
jgi:hypothetical protein